MEAQDSRSHEPGILVYGQSRKAAVLVCDLREGLHRMSTFGDNEIDALENTTKLNALKRLVGTR